MPRSSLTVDPSLDERLRFERKAESNGFSAVAGVDEAGRGPWAGPVVAACVLLPPDLSGLEAVNDSKKISADRRDALYEIIRERALGIGVGQADAATIDRVNILQATFLAMHEAVKNMPQPPDFLLIDGNRKPQWAISSETIVRGDSLSISIAAASIIAKVTRDRMMMSYDREYPGWGFAQHKGYGTQAHQEAIRRLGLCPIHRRSFSPMAQMDFPAVLP